MITACSEPACVRYRDTNRKSGLEHRLTRATSTACVSRATSADFEVNGDPQAVTDAGRQCSTMPRSPRLSVRPQRRSSGSGTKSDTPVVPANTKNSA